MKACYRKLLKYKYQLVKDYKVVIPIKGKTILEDYIELYPNGILLIKKGYAWDGPSGPTIDTLSFMRGSLVHDVLYQLIRMRLLDLSYRKRADQIIRQICLEDGMSRIRAGYVYRSLRWFGGKAATPGTQKPDVITCVPILSERKA